MNDGPATTVPPRNRGWIWYFVALAVLALGAAITLVTYNLRQQLTLQQLAAAEQKWQRNGPRDYDMEYTKQGSAAGTYQVKVRDGVVTYAEPDERPLAQKRPYYSMEALFSYVEDFLKEDSRPGAPRTYAVASFDPEDGHLVHYVRRVMGTNQRLELTVQLTRVEPEKPGDSSRASKAEPAASGKK
jgi:hypothetical protein